MAGCTKGAISHYEKGRRQLTLQRCQRIVEIFNMLGFKCSLDDVFPSSGNKAA
ncbi:helix-turn-helix domain-containing protein [Serratia ureilytica]